MENQKITMSFEYLMTNLFGKTYHGFIDIPQNLSSWKKETQKIARAINKSIKMNVTTDLIHYNDILWQCKNVESKLKAAKSINEINIHMIEFQTRVMFLLLGQLPNHWNSRIVNKDIDWKLDVYRSVTFNQSIEQKVNLILSLKECHGFSDSLKEVDLVNKYFSECKGDQEAFINWFKYAHTDIYLKLF